MTLAPGFLRVARALLLGLAALVLLLWSGESQACAVCFQADGEARKAYYATTLLMIGVPAVAGGWLYYWLRGALR